jgi:capsular exopolysaccharide synthesis family protein
MITATNESNTQLVTIITTAKTAELAVHLANAVAAEAEVSMTDTLGNFKALPRTSATYATLSRTDARISRALAFAVIGTVLSYAVLLALNFADRRMKRADEADDFADYLPHLGKAASLELLRTGNCDAQYEAYNRIRTNLNARLTGTECPTVAVTAPTQKEDSAISCENLAFSFARLGRRVLLIDADMRGTSPDIFGEGLGFSDLLDGKDVAPHAADEENLFILGRGTSKRNPTDLLASAAFVATLDGLKANYDIVFINLPPVIGTADAMAVSQRLTGTVMTFTVGTTDRREASEALSSLYNVGAPLLGSITVG